MKLTLRFVIPLLLTLSAIAYVTAPLVDAFTTRWFNRDLELRSRLITSTMQESLTLSLQDGSVSKVNAMLNRATQDERLMAIAFCNAQNVLKYKTQLFPKEIDCLWSQRFQASSVSQVIHLSPGDIHISDIYIDEQNASLGRLLFIHDMSFIQRRSADTKKYLIGFFVVLGLLISAVTVFIAQLSWRGWVGTLRAFIAGEGLLKPITTKKGAAITPIIKEFRALIKQMESSQRVRDEGMMTWTPKTLKDLLSRELSGEEIITVANREPYIHHKDATGNVEMRNPASGLVTAIEPIMRACSGTWIAHGSGNADKENSDRNGKLQVPPGNPSYTLKRIWLTDEEERGYYYGFANEGLWPLCHIAHTRPTFRSQDWEQYVKVNQKFADAVVAEAKTDDPVVLVQDYHFALLPKMVKKQLPNATIITFWHIPWPNPEAFGICPWREEILEGMLGSSILGFHIQFHCNNFMETVDRFMECRVDREHSTISYLGKVTAINPYPISIEWPPKWAKEQKPIPECRANVFKKNLIPGDVKIGLGVDRLDYTKGIAERFLAVEKLLDIHPEWIGKFTFIQIAAPSRTTIDTYKRLEYDVRAIADRVNQRFRHGEYQPIVLKIEHHEPPSVYEYYRAADFCFVSSLHDGMNLVAKEYVAAKEDEKGILILSLFAGASKELPEALIVNPYDIDLCAEALNVALTMPPAEQKERMKSMRAYVREYNVFRWAGRMLIDASRIRQRNRLMKRVSVLNSQKKMET